MTLDFDVTSDDSWAHAMHETARWTEQDFDTLSWHDCHVHGIRLRNPDEGYDFDLVLDIDYILEWITTPQGRFNFVVAPALLIFNTVDKLVVDLELAYKEDLVIDAIRREEAIAQSELGLHTAQWTVHFRSFAGRDNQVRFRSNGFILTLTKPPRTIENQRLGDDER